MIIDGADEGLCKLALSAAVALKETGIKPDVIIPVPGERELFCAARASFQAEKLAFRKACPRKNGIVLFGRYRS